MKTEEQARGLLEALGKMQVEARVFDLPCPRCGRQNMDPIAVRNALSRYAKVYVCNACGMEEAMRDMAGEPPLPLNLWGMVRAFDDDREAEG